MSICNKFVYFRGHLISYQSEEKSFDSSNAYSIFIKIEENFNSR